MFKKFLLSFLVLSSLCLSINSVFAAGIPADTLNQLKAAGGEQGAGYGAPKDPRSIAVTIIKTALGLLGTIFIVLIIYAGFLWMTAGGEEEKTKKATTLITQAVIGLAIVLSAYAITVFAVNFAMGNYDDLDRMGGKLF